jgi:hypothetical protein
MDHPYYVAENYRDTLYPIILILPNHRMYRKERRRMTKGPGGLDHGRLTMGDLVRLNANDYTIAWNDAIGSLFSHQREFESLYARYRDGYMSEYAKRYEQVNKEQDDLDMAEMFEELWERRHDGDGSEDS